ncbi:MAG: GldG family protein [Verrucomicrobiaceae bacterium]|nr:GldG family protein [Verrucomicrobiaceae bacterium]
MNLNSKQATTGITFLIVAAILVVLNYLVGGIGVGNVRMDLTQDKLYTLSDGTRNILKSIKEDKPVTIRYYVTTEDRVMPPILKTYARTVQDLLLEFEKSADGRVVLEKLNPNPNTEDEDKAREDDIQGMQVNTEGDNIYLGLSIQSAEKKEVIPFMNPNEETALEYNVARAIAKVIKTTKTIVGVMSPMPVQGTPQMPFMMQQQQGQQQPWVIVQRLRMDYEVRDVPMTADKIDSDISVLVVIHPAGITDVAEYAIDQYVLKGGHVIAFVDPQCWVAQVYSNHQQNPMMGGQPNMISPSSELKNLFKSWGVGFANDQIVADMSYVSMMQGRKNPTALSLPSAAINKKDRVTAELQSLTMVGAGALNVEKTEGITAVPVIESSENSEMIDTATAEKLRTQQLTSFNASGRKKTLGVRLTGKFKTAFPNGKPKSPGDENKEKGGAQDDPSAPKPASQPAANPTPPAAPVPPPAAVPKPAAPSPAVATPAPATPPTAPKPAAPPAGVAAPPPAAKAPPPVIAVPAPGEPTTVVPAKVDAGPPNPAAGAVTSKAADAKSAEAPKNDGSLKAGEKEGTVILFADADMMFDAFSVQQDRMTGGIIPINSNLPMFLNAVELLAGGGDLLSVRSRASTQRPFKKLDEMRDSVEKQFRPRLESLNQKLQETAQKISTLRLKKDKGSQMLILDPTQVKDLEAMQATQAQINKEIREVKKEQNKEIDKVENRLMWANVAGMPVVVIIIGLVLALRRRIATAAR